jgi:hypothetical protein
LGSKNLLDKKAKQPFVGEARNGCLAQDKSQNRHVLALSFAYAVCVCAASCRAAADGIHRKYCRAGETGCPEKRLKLISHRLRYRLNLSQKQNHMEQSRGIRRFHKLAAEL